jgi:hypothetical protein
MFVFKHAWNYRTSLGKFWQSSVKSLEFFCTRPVGLLLYMTVEIMMNLFKISFSVVRNVYWIICPPNLPAQRIWRSKKWSDEIWRVLGSWELVTLNLCLASYLPFVHHSNANNALGKLFLLPIRIEKQLSVYISNYTKTNFKQGKNSLFLYKTCRTPVVHDCWDHDEHDCVFIIVSVCGHPP